MLKGIADPTIFKMQAGDKVICFVEVKAVKMLYICSGIYTQDNYSENSVQT